MEQAASSSSGSVKVEFNDPFGISHLISDDFQARLPLRNLHWNSASRPLRSIDSLYIELIPSPANESDLRSRPLSAINGSSAGEGLQTANGEPSRTEARPISQPKERRHQIPGLRQTPYLKVFFLRCDDVDTYRASSRKLLRDWIKEQTLSAQGTSGGQEYHDASEWLIVHVVIPDARAVSSADRASQAKGEAQDDQIKSSSPWQLRSAATVFEKMRSDFNGPSKAIADRVVQVYASKGPNDAAPVISPEEYRKASSRGWDELLVSIKALILASFDLRVKQYEEDIREKGYQRNVPGWNFCTYFVLKEGLARGFENVGLVEDALMGYDELSLELEAAIIDQKVQASTGQPAGLFQETTQDLLVQAEKALEMKDSPGVSGPEAASPQQLIIDSDRKPYRELILANNISAFDFQCYAFSRKVALLLRLASRSPSTGHSPVSQVNSPTNQSTPQLRQGMDVKDQEDLAILADICHRSIAFITAAGSVMREDLALSFVDRPGLEESTQQLRLAIAENIISSWTLTAAQEILHKTNAPLLQAQLASQPKDRPLIESHHSQGSVTSPVTGRSPFMARFPARHSSLLGRMSPITPSVRPESLASPEAPPSSKSLAPPRPLPTGMQDLVAQRAELYLVARQVLTHAALRYGWTISWDTLLSSQDALPEVFEDVSLDSKVTATKDERQDGQGEQCQTLLGIENKSFRAALDQEETFHSLYEDWTTAASLLFRIASRIKAAAAMCADIALIRFHHKDYFAAAENLRLVIPVYAQDDWNSLEVALLDLYVQSLKKLDRTDERVRASLDLLSKLARDDEGSQLSLSNPFAGKKTYFQDLLSASKELDEPIQVPMDGFFRDISVRPQILHFQEKDGFRLLLQFRYLIRERMIVEEVKVKIVSTDERQARDIWLTSEGSREMIMGPNEVYVGSHVLMPSWYRVEIIIITSAQVKFSQILSTGLSSDGVISSLSDLSSIQQPRILLWPRARALELRLLPHDVIHLEESRSIVIQVASAGNSIEAGELRVKSGTAGMRLLVADAEIIHQGEIIRKMGRTGVVPFGKLAADSMLKIRIPYRLELEVKEISVKAEISYSTGFGAFQFASNLSLSVLLPLGVNVQDIFKQDSLFSKFSISTAASVPLRLVRCSLIGTEDFEVSSPPWDAAGLTIFVKQPVSVLYKIKRKDREHKTSRGLQTRLLMHVDFQCLDEEILASCEKAFDQVVGNGHILEYSRLLKPFLLSSLRSKMYSQSLDDPGMLHEFDIGPPEDLKLDSVLRAVSEEHRKPLSQELKTWYQEHKTMTLFESGGSAHVRRITIPVDIPQMQVVFTARLVFSRQDPQSSITPDAVNIGQPLHAQLIISYSRTWDTRASLLQHKTDSLECSYDVEANNDTWMIGGQKRVYFTARENDMLKFPVLLIPQRSGRLLYPAVDIRVVNEEKRAEHSNKSSALTTSETNYQNQGETFLVVPNLRSTTVSLHPDGLAGGAWLVESSRRQDVAHG